MNGVVKVALAVGMLCLLYAGPAEATLRRRYKRQYYPRGVQAIHVEPLGTVDNRTCTGRLEAGCIRARVVGIAYDWARAVTEAAHKRWMKREITDGEKDVITKRGKGAALAEKVTAAEQLTELDASDNILSAAGMKAASAALARHPRLQTLALRFNGLGEDAAPHLAKVIAGSRSLERLDLARNGLFSAESGRVLGEAIRKSNTRLKWLQFASQNGRSGGGFAAEVVQGLLAPNEGPAISNNEAAIAYLEYLSFHSSSLGDEGAAALALLLAHPMSALRTLDLTSSGVTAEGAAALITAATSSYTSLDNLYLGWNWLIGRDEEKVGLVADAFAASAAQRKQGSPGGRVPCGAREVLKYLDLSGCGLESVRAADMLGRLANAGVGTVQARVNALSIDAVRMLASRLRQEYNQAASKHATGSCPTEPVLTLRELILQAKFSTEAVDVLRLAAEYTGINIVAQVMPDDYDD